MNDELRENISLRLLKSGQNGQKPPKSIKWKKMCHKDKRVLSSYKTYIMYLVCSGLNYSNLYITLSNNILGIGFKKMELKISSEGILTQEIIMKVTTALFSNLLECVI